MWQCKYNVLGWVWTSCFMAVGYIEWADYRYIVVSACRRYLIGLLSQKERIFSFRHHFPVFTVSNGYRVRDFPANLDRCSKHSRARLVSCSGRMLKWGDGEDGTGLLLPRFTCSASTESWRGPAYNLRVISVFLVHRENAILIGDLRQAQLRWRNQELVLQLYSDTGFGIFRIVCRPTELEEEHRPAM